MKRLTLTLLTFAAVLPLACADGKPGSASDPDRAPADSVLQEPAPAELLRAAEQVVRFLQGRSAFEESLVADTVTLYVSPEGGGGVARVARSQLQQLENWRVESGRTTYRLAPPAQFTDLTTRVATHFACLEYPLATRYPELATLPHVGTKLSPPTGSCLQTWNLTLVFAREPAPRLVAAVYDQWEW